MANARPTIMSAEDEAPRCALGEFENGLEGLEECAADVSRCTALRRAADSVTWKLRYEE